MFHSLFHRKRTENDDGHAIEDCSDVRQKPQKQSELEWVNEILDQEEATQLGDVRVDVSHDDASNLLDLLRRQR